jgi:hypothetical protein
VRQLGEFRTQIGMQQVDEPRGDVMASLRRATATDPDLHPPADQ